ncbi:Methyltransferase domain-containing protein [Candidatus Electrothrix aarhusensis]|uniref:Methyltransferase domain-containing protein n=1 Tax=Candidatus Electrothrix aarhusensis TaxID=1859131 RepID=A0A3S4TAT3_9BACT|nr:Methyltransferase domain-containing protein [Candidatus Electrothrix aarhusensis]
MMNRQGIWDFWAKYYDRLWLQRVSLQPTRALVCEKIMGFEGNQNTAQKTSQLNILDMGCGTGQLYGDLLQALGKKQFHYLGIDPSGAMLEQAVDKFPEAAFFRSDVMDAEPDQAPFDVIVCSHSFPYYPDGEAALRNMADMLRPGGQLLLSQACTNSVYDAVILKLTGLTTSKAVYRSSQHMTELGSSLFRELETFRISEKFFTPSLWLFHWIK